AGVGEAVAVGARVEGAEALGVRPGARQRQVDEPAGPAVSAGVSGNHQTALAAQGSAADWLARKRSQHRRTASTLRSMSVWVVFHDETEMRMAVRPCHTVGLTKSVPSPCTALTTRLVVSVSPKLISAWLRTTSLSTSQPARAS